MATSSIQSSPLEPFLEAERVVILDGGLATELESHGFDLNDDLWSAKILLEQPEGIRSVHLDYLRAGADCIASASYQATLEGFMGRGLSKDAAAELIQGSVALALEARDQFWSDPEHRIGRLKPLVAASVGPYGAYLADGSEFRGDYDLDEDALVDFHRERWCLLASSGADLLACETIPSRHEARALRRLLEESPDTQALFSFSCKDGAHIADGQKLSRAAKMLDLSEQVVAIGVNCTAPQYVSPLMDEIRSESAKPIVVYPNSGEGWDAERKQWTGVAEPVHFGSKATEWFNLGAACIGGCCRTGPEHVREIRAALVRAVEGT